MPPFRDWASLSPDLVELIGWRVLDGDLPDYVRFRAACSPWRAATVRPHILDPRFHPRRWMMLPEGHGLYPGHPDLGGFARFVNLSTGAFVRAHLPLLEDHVILASVDGLLLLHRDHDTVVRLLHPFTGDVVDLPPLASLLPHVENVPSYAPRGYKRRLLTETDAFVPVVSRGTVTVMLGLVSLDRVAYANAGDQQWTVSDWNFEYYFGAPVTSNGNIYMLHCPNQSQENQSQDVHIYRLDPPCTTAADGIPHFPVADEDCRMHIGYFLPSRVWLRDAGCCLQG